MRKFDGLNVSPSTVYIFMRTDCNLSLRQAELQSVERNKPEKIEERHDWVRKWEQTDMDFMTNCVFLDESAFHITMKRTRTWSKKGAISASGLIKILWMKWDKYLQMKGHYLVMDNAPIHKSEDLTKYRYWVTGLNLGQRKASAKAAAQNTQCLGATDAWKDYAGQPLGPFTSQALLLIVTDPWVYRSLYAFHRLPLCQLSWV
ncbi:hypothetical protein VTP01DRAFT_5277 [Rhizomucor pusillus]|uniref:uncharacterized protein n=1 Tax=Rhizomucor pusillus TaxID=4840 RepID=UPI003742E356